MINAQEHSSACNPHLTMFLIWSDCEMNQQDEISKTGDQCSGALKCWKYQLISSWGMNALSGISINLNLRIGRTLWNMNQEDETSNKAGDSLTMFPISSDSVRWIHKMRSQRLVKNPFTPKWLVEEFLSKRSKQWNIYLIQSTSFFRWMVPKMTLRILIIGWNIKVKWIQITKYL